MSCDSPKRRHQENQIKKNAFTKKRKKNVTRKGHQWEGRTHSSPIGSHILLYLMLSVERSLGDAQPQDLLRKVDQPNDELYATSAENPYAT